MVSSRFPQQIQQTHPLTVSSSHPPTEKTSLSTYSICDRGVPGFKTTPAMQPIDLIWFRVRCRWMVEAAWRKVLLFDAWDMRYWMRIVNHGISRSKMEKDVENEDGLMITKDQEWWNDDEMMKWWEFGNTLGCLQLLTTRGITHGIHGTLQSLGMAAVQNLSNTVSP